MASVPTKPSGPSKTGGPPRDSTKTSTAKTQVPRPNKIERPDVDEINRAAEGFLQIYYDRMDGGSRDANIVELYRESSVMIWNGETVNGAQKVWGNRHSTLHPKRPHNGLFENKIKEFLATMPESKHEIQSWDCHPIPGHTPAPILITVSGMVTHGDIPIKVPSTKKPGVLPRIFSQTFVLAPEPGLSIVPEAGTADPTAAAAQGSDVYYIRSDTLRFVG
ncbi:hypothetical protein FRC18_001619 [Serendipita sp. 400]|nr:hypothetical protein FRC18_001619 [Serendipita sp. 400]